MPVSIFRIEAEFTEYFNISMTRFGAENNRRITAIIYKLSILITAVQIVWPMYIIRKNNFPIIWYVELTDEFQLEDRHVMDTITNFKLAFGLNVLFHINELCKFVNAELEKSALWTKVDLC